MRDGSTHHGMTVDGKGEVGIARGRNKTETVACPAVDRDYGQRSQRATKIATLAVDEGRVGGRHKSGRWSRGVVPVGEGDDSGLVIDVVPNHDEINRAIIRLRQRWSTHRLR